jgi:hypothetical protein
MPEVLSPPGLKIVEGNDVSAFAKESIAQVRPEESGSACNKNELAFAILHEDDLLDRTTDDGIGVLTCVRPTLKLGIGSTPNLESIHALRP